MMALRRIWGLMYRHLALYRRSWPRLLELTYWPTLQMCIWGFTSSFIASRMGMGGIGDMRPKQQNAASDLRAGVRTAQADKLAPPIALQKLRPKIARTVGLLPAQGCTGCAQLPHNARRAHRA